jgi:Fic-DOC domain mobile mystery protein B
MGLVLEYGEGQTPLDEEEKEGLRISTITTKGELDEFEQLNTQKGLEWSLKRKWTAEKLFTEGFVRQLHKEMYGEVWKWAGKFRLTNKNIGVDRSIISVELKNLLDDALYWIANKTYVPDEIAVRFKHRIVSIHCFPNGNGRHSRLIADIIIETIGKQPPFSWGNSKLIKADLLRKGYITALRKADQGNISELIKFARS